MERRASIFTILILVICLLFWNLNKNFGAIFDYNNNEITKKEAFSGPVFELMTTHYDLHDPISISSDTAFNDTAYLEGWSGNGTASNPYIIENLRIQTSSGSAIGIRYTSVHFKIINCLLITGGIGFTNTSHFTIFNCTLFESGVYLTCGGNGSLISNELIDGRINIDRSDYVLIANNTITTSKTGVSLNALYFKSLNIVDYPEYIKMINNTIHCTDNYGYGVQLNDVPYATIVENQISGYGCGIWGDLFNSTISYNHIFDNIREFGGAGIQIWGDYINISHNLIHNNSQHGISCGLSDSFIHNNTVNNNEIGIIITSGHRNIILQNSLLTNTQNGLHLKSSHFGAIENNTFIDNGYYGLYLESAVANQIQWNKFLNNSPFESSQAYDDYKGVSSNNFTQNQWSDWCKPDVDGDGFVDQPYLIDGQANNTDLFPLFNCTITDSSYPTTSTITHTSRSSYSQSHDHTSEYSSYFTKSTATTETTSQSSFSRTDNLSSFWSLFLLIPTFGILIYFRRKK